MIEILSLAFGAASFLWSVSAWWLRRQRRRRFSVTRSAVQLELFRARAAQFVETLPDRRFIDDQRRRALAAPPLGELAAIHREVTGFVERHPADAEAARLLDELREALRREGGRFVHVRRVLRTFVVVVRRSIGDWLRRSLGEARGVDLGPMALRFRRTEAPPHPT